MKRETNFLSRISTRFLFILFILLSSSFPANATCSITSGACGVSPGTCLTGNVTGDDGITACGTTRHWGCTGVQGGTTASCSMANAACPVNGVCGGSANSCNAGNPSGYSAGVCGGNQTWICNGISGGSNTSCTLANAACPINGACNNGVALGCSAGSATGDNGQTGCGTTRQWYCTGANGGSNSGTCSIANAACAASCPSAYLYWGACCGASFPSTASGNTANKVDAGGGGMGHATCNNGSWISITGTCTMCGH